MDTQTEAARPATPRTLTFGEHAAAFVRELLAVLIGAIVVSSLLRGFVGQMFIIPSDSMLETLQRGDRVVVEKISTIQRGQVVVFVDPGGWLSGPAAAQRGPVGQALEFVGVLPDTSAEHLIKRAVGLPGDRVVCCDARGRLSVNGAPLVEDYLYAPGGERPERASDIAFDVVVPADRIFVLGDNRGNSRDSRCHLGDGDAANRGDSAFIPLDLVVGRTLAVAWPAAEARRLSTPAAYASVPGPRAAVPAEPVIRAGAETRC